MKKLLGKVFSPRPTIHSGLLPYLRPGAYNTIFFDTEYSFAKKIYQETFLSKGEGNSEENDKER